MVSCDAVPGRSGCRFTPNSGSCAALSVHTFGWSHLRIPGSFYDPHCRAHQDLVHCVPPIALRSVVREHSWNSGRVLLKSGQLRDLPKSAESGSNSTELGRKATEIGPRPFRPNSATLARHRPTRDRFRPMLGRVRPKWTNTWPNSTKTESDSARRGQTSTKSGPRSDNTLSETGQCRPTSAEISQLRSKLARNRPTLVRTRSTSAHFRSDLAPEIHQSRPILARKRQGLDRPDLARCRSNLGNRGRRNDVDSERFSSGVVYRGGQHRPMPPGDTQGGGAGAASSRSFLFCPLSEPSPFVERRTGGRENGTKVRRGGWSQHPLPDSASHSPDLEDGIGAAGAF